MKITSEVTAIKTCELGSGEGRNSTVYLAYDPQIGTEVALKEMPESDFSNPDHYFTEAQQIQACKHPCVVPIHYGCRGDGSVRLVMPFYRNGSVQGLINSEGPLTVRRAQRLIQDFLLGLHHIHVQGVLHCDLKPTNLLLSDEGRVMVTDFGLSQYTDPYGVTDVPIKSYVLHMLPEWIEGTGSTVHSDIYQAGLTIYRMVNGNEVWAEQIERAERAIAGDIARLNDLIMAGRFPERSSFLPHIPLRMQQAIRKALKVRPAERFSTAREFSDALAKVDRQLDWRCRPEPSGIAWTRDLDGMHSEIILQREGRRWRIRGTHGREGQPRRRAKWSPTGTFVRNDAFRFLTEAFRGDR